jgi:drug/metabolite transporter (DMT)-like permease
LHFTVMLWGLTALLGKGISVGPRVLVFYRVVIVTVVMAVAVERKKLGFAVPRAHLVELVGAGACVAVHWMLFYAAVKTAGIALAVLCLSTVTFFTSLLEPWVFRKRTKGYELLLGFGVVIGVALLLRFETHATPMGYVLGLGSAVFSAAFGTWNARLGKREPAERLTLYELGTAAVVTATTFAFVPGFVFPWAVSARDWLMLFVLAIGCTALPWMWSLRILKTLSAFTVALAVAVEPVWSLVFAYVAWPNEERLGPRFYAGAAALGVLLAVNAWMKKGSDEIGLDRARDAGQKTR